jgi:hypothetical protein
MQQVGSVGKNRCAVSIIEEMLSPQKLSTSKSSMVNQMVNKRVVHHF